MRIMCMLGAAALAVSAGAATPAAAAPPVPPDLQIELSDGRQDATAGDRLDYTVTVRNDEARPSRGTVRVELPADTSYVSGDKGAAVANGAVSWKAAPASGEPAVVHFTVALGERRAPQARAMAMTACALVDGVSRPVVCATDINPLTNTAMASGIGGGTLVAGGGLALLAAGAVALLLRRRRRATAV